MSCLILLKMEKKICTFNTFVLDQLKFSGWMPLWTGMETGKADIRPNLSKVDVWIFRTLTMVSQHSKGSYKVPWRPIGIEFWETTTLEPKKGPAG